MPLAHPPRREPRVLAVAARGVRLAFVVADPWEIRSSGSAAWRARCRGPALVRLIRREKPTLLVASRRLAAELARYAPGVPVIAAGRRPLPPDVARDLYPEFPVFAPTPMLVRVATVAIATTLRADLPIRPYAPRRHKSIPRSRSAA